MGNRVIGEVPAVRLHLPDHRAECGGQAGVTAFGVKVDDLDGGSQGAGVCAGERCQAARPEVRFQPWHQGFTNGFRLFHGDDGWELRFLGISISGEVRIYRFQSSEGLFSISLLPSGWAGFLGDVRHVSHMASPEAVAEELAVEFPEAGIPPETEDWKSVS